MVKDLVKCIECGRVQLVQVFADTCPTCATEASLNWCNKEIQKIDTNKITIQPSINNGWKVIKVANSINLMYYPLEHKVILQNSGGIFSLNNCNEEVFLKSDLNTTFEKALSYEDIFCLTF